MNKPKSRLIFEDLDVPMGIIRLSILIGILLLIAFSVSAKLPEGDLLAGVNPDENGRIDILLVFAHQDDESIYSGGAVLKAMKHPRVRLYILCMTFDQTSEAKDVLGITPDHIGNIRIKELETAATVYQAEAVIHFKYASHTLGEQDPEKVIEEIKEVIDKTGAEIVLTHDPAGITAHPDHIACNKFATEAFKRSDAQVLYYPVFPSWFYPVFLRFFPNREPGEPAKPDFKVNIREQKKLKRMACYAHASQMKFTSVGGVSELMLLKNYEYFSRVIR